MPKAWLRAVVAFVQGAPGAVGRNRRMKPSPPIRIVPYPSGSDMSASREFYVEALGLQVAMEDPVLCLGSPANPSAQVILSPPGFEDPQPSFGLDLGDPDAVGRRPRRCRRARDFRVVYPLTDEPWGVRRFFVEDPGGTIVNVLAHMA